MRYTGKTIIEIAQERGSKANTRKGCWAFLLKNLPGPTPTENSRPWEWKLWAESRRDRTGDGRARVLGYDLEDPNTPGRIWESAREENRKWDADCRIQVQRGTYGDLSLSHNAPASSRPRPEVAGLSAARKLVDDAGKAGAITGSYDGIEFDDKGRADGSALHHEIYDFAPDAVVVCLRETEGTRYGVKTLTKKYFLIVRKGDKITATETNEPVAKLAKSGAAFGSIVARIRGGEGAAKLPGCPDEEWGFKALALVAGKLRSIYSGEEYRLGEEKHQGAQRGHKGGYYFYSTPELAVRAEVPDESKYKAAPRVIVRCRCNGKRVAYGNKIARTSITPIDEWMGI